MPLLSYKAYQLLRYRSTNEFRKRHPLYLFLLYFFVLFHVAVQEPFCLIILYPSPTFFAGSNYGYNALSAAIVHVFGFFVITGFFLLFLSRAWILYHDYRFNDSIANLCWRLEIQPTYKNDNWWISRRAIYGNPKFILIFMCIAWILLLILYCVIYFLLGLNSDEEVDKVMEWLMAVFAIIPISVAYAVVHYNIRAITDVFNIRKELLYTIRICILCVTVFFFLLIISSALKHSFNSAPMVCLQSAVTGTAGGVIILLNVKYIHKSVRKNTDDDAEHSLTQKYGVNIPDMTLEDILEDRTGFESFMKHLVQEFSVENLLFVAEVQQFRSTLAHEPTGQELESAEVPTLRLNWLPLSVGLKNDTPWYRAQYIYSKFICKTALHQINISHRCWMQVSKFFPELSALNDTNNVAALPTRGGKIGKIARPNDYNYYYKHSMNYSISSDNYNISTRLDMPDSKKRKLMEEKKKFVASSTNGTAPNIKRRVTPNRTFRALSDKYLKGSRLGKAEAKVQHFKSSTDIHQHQPEMTESVELLAAHTDSDKNGDGEDEDVADDAGADHDGSNGRESVSSDGSNDDNTIVIKADGEELTDVIATASPHHKLSTATEEELVSFKYELYHVFDDAEREVWLLMKDSLTRYQQTDTYEKLAIGKALRSKRRATGNKTSRGMSMDSNTGGVSSFWKELRTQLSISGKVTTPTDRKASDLKEPLLSMDETTATS